MKNFKLSTMLLTVSLLITISSCKKIDDQLASSTEVSQNTLKSAAMVYKYHNVIDISEGWIEFNGCTGEWIKIVKGIYHIDFHYTINGNRVTVVDHSNTSDYNLIDEATGVEYKGSYVTNDSETYTYTGSNLSFEWSGTLKTIVTTPGQGNNGIYTVDYHATVNANGEVTVNFFNPRVGCQ